MFKAIISDTKTHAYLEEYDTDNHAIKSQLISRTDIIASVSAELRILIDKNRELPDEEKTEEIICLHDLTISNVPTIPMYPVYKVLGMGWKSFFAQNNLIDIIKTTSLPKYLLKDDVKPIASNLWLPEIETALKYTYFGDSSNFSEYTLAIDDQLNFIRNNFLPNVSTLREIPLSLDGSDQKLVDKLNYIMGTYEGFVECSNIEFNDINLMGNIDLFQHAKGNNIILPFNILKYHLKVLGGLPRISIEKILIATKVKYKRIPKKKKDQYFEYAFMSEGDNPYWSLYVRFYFLIYFLRYLQNYKNTNLMFVDLQNKVISVDTAEDLSDSSGNEIKPISGGKGNK